MRLEQLARPLAISPACEARTRHRMWGLVRCPWTLSSWASCLRLALLALTGDDNPMYECMQAEARVLNLGRTSWHYDGGRRAAAKKYLKNFEIWLLGSARRLEKRVKAVKCGGPFLLVKSRTPDTATQTDKRAGSEPPLHARYTVPQRIRHS